MCYQKKKKNYSHACDGVNQVSIHLLFKWRLKSEGLFGKSDLLEINLSRIELYQMEQLEIVALQIQCLTCEKHSIV